MTPNRYRRYTFAPRQAKKRETLQHTGAVDRRQHDVAERPRRRAIRRYAVKRQMSNDIASYVVPAVAAGTLGLQLAK